MRRSGVGRAMVLWVSLGLAVPLAAQEIDPEAFAAEEALAPGDLRQALVELLSQDEGDPAASVTAGDPDIPESALSILLKPLALDQLRDEIAAWHAILIASVEDLARAELALFESAEQAAAAGQDAGADREGGGQGGAGAASGLSPEEAALVERIAELRSVRTARADRLRLILNAYEAKGGDPADTAEIRAYLAEVGGVNVDTRNLHTAWLTIRQWAAAQDGGLRVLRRVATVLGATVMGGLLGWVVSLIVNRGLKSTELSSRLLRHFLRRWIGRLGGLVGFLLGLSWIGTNMTPILAALGAAGFIIAFALQNTIANFASGLLILFQRPFDAGDEVEAAGITGEVERVSLFSTHLSTAENRKVIVPNNMIWEDVIVNSTGAPTRRLAIEIEVSAEEHSLDEAEATLLRIMRGHDGVLDDPPPEIKLAALTATEMTFLCWPWVRTEEKDRVRWDLVAQFGRDLAVTRGVTKSGGV